MKLNKYSYVHIKIRKLSQYLAYLTDMEVLTDFDEEFEDVRLVNDLCYITLDYKNHVCFCMSHKLTKEEQEIIEEIMISLDWLEVGRRYQITHK